MSTVYLAIQESVGRVVALKVMSPALNGDPSFSERFQREANIVGQLSHPHIVSIYDIGKHDNLNYIAMDYLPGGSIHDKMLAGMEGASALKILKEIGAALDHAHEKGYVHRDIKPENILFRDDGSAVLTDFGVARAQSLHSRATHAGTVVGTPHYMSPEQTRGKAVDSRSDLYSLGIVFYEMLTGSVPYQGEEAVAIALKHLAAPLPALPSHYIRFQPILDKLLDKDPAKRYQNGRELVHDIDVLQLQMREQGEDFLSSQGGLVSQFGNLFNLLARRTRASVKNGVAMGISYVSAVRFNKKRGFFRQDNQIDTSTHRLTQQNTLVETKVHPQAQANTLLVAWREIPLLNRQLIIAACAVCVIAIVLLIWQGSSNTKPELTTTLHGPLSTSESTSAGQASSATGQYETGSGEPPISVEPFKNKPLLAAEHNNALTPNLADEQTSLTTTTDDNAAPADKDKSEPASQTVTAIEPDSSAVSAQASDAAKSSIPAEPNESDTLFALAVQTKPANARVRIMNIREKYHEGIALASGRYQVEVTAPGYRKYLQWTQIKDEDVRLEVTLAPSREPGSEFQDSLASGGKGPVMTVIPAGRFNMGGPETAASPGHTVTLENAIAMSKYEVTFEEYERFAKHQSMPLPGDNRWGREQRPVINISWEEAKLYAKWLSNQTGKTYRLPTEAEWEYAAKAGKNTAYWWGDNPEDASGKANCRRHCDSEYTGLFRSESAPVGSFAANGFGLHDTAGNVAEWIEDCYRDTYDNADASSQAYQQENCPARVVRGGSMNDDAEAINSYSRRFQPQHTYHTDIGIRLVVEQF
ncbi:bifunctional serine/threonine-protein kinase/formylglycine-generating enzyme family protein [Gilvimarinus chinensis]|uniref:bifunctional serine/threonine-protein kinase/formylglycine-generating enzyme family protein n=1 Tax=Gilvimarinus chinensis TaxID=396005 RepID=UPI0003A0898E